MNDLKCIYCRRVLDEKTAWAHVVPNALGGRLSTNKTVCTVCNRATKVAEDHVVDAFRPLAALLGANRGDRKPTTPFRFKRRGPEDREEVEVLRGILTTRRNSLLPERLGDVQSISMRGSSVDVMVSEYVDRMFRDGVRLADFLGVRVEAPPLGEVEPRHRFLMTLEPPIVARAAIKMALELLAFHDRDRQLASAGALADARSTAVKGKPAALACLQEDYEFRGPLADACEPDFATAIEVWTTVKSNGMRGLLVRLRLYGYFTFLVPLVAPWDGPSVAAYYAIDPIDPTFQPTSTLVPHPAVAWPDGWGIDLGCRPDTAAKLITKVSGAVDSYISGLPRPATDARQPSGQEWSDLIAAEYKRRIGKRRR